MKKKNTVIALLLTICVGMTSINSFAFDDKHNDSRDFHDYKLILLDRLGTSILDIATVLESKDSTVLGISFNDEENFAMTAFVEEDGAIYKVSFESASNKESKRNKVGFKRNKVGFWSGVKDDWKNLPKEQIKISASEIIKKVEDSLEGKVLEIDLESKKEIMIYEVLVVSTHDAHKVLVDPFTGTIYQNLFANNRHKIER